MLSENHAEVYKTTFLFHSATFFAPRVSVSRLKGFCTVRLRALLGGRLSSRSGKGWAWNIRFWKT